MCGGGGVDGGFVWTGERGVDGGVSFSYLTATVSSVLIRAPCVSISAVIHSVTGNKHARHVALGCHS